MFRASQLARKCFHLLRTLEEVEKAIALLNDKVRHQLVASTLEPT
jgi:hypothetical protein